MMDRHGIALIPTLTVALLCTGCDALGNLGKSDDERINEAVPISNDVLNQIDKFEAAIANNEDRATFSTELKSRHTIRALTCAGGYKPSVLHSKDKVRQSLTNRRCFEEYDRSTLQWLGIRRLAILLNAPPLRDVSETPVAIFATSSNVNAIKFARSASIAVATSNKSVEVIDMATGKSLFIDKELPRHPSFIAVSNNGRVFAVGDSEAGIVLRSAEDGDSLQILPDYQRIEWLDATVAVALLRTNRGAELIDISRDTREPIKGEEPGVTRIVPLGDAAGTFLLCGYRSISKYRLERNGSTAQAQLIDRKNGPPMPWSENVSDLTSDGKYFIQASNDLWVTNLETLETEQISLKPLSTRSATSLTSPSEVLLQVASTGSSQKSIVYSLTDRNFAVVEDEELSPAQGYAAARTAYVPAFGKVVAITGSTVKVIEDLKRGSRYSPEAFGQLIAEEQRLEMQKNAIAAAQRAGYSASEVVNGVAVKDGPIAILAKNATVEGIGVYESARGSHGIGKPRVAGDVNVYIQGSGGPVILVLSSYEPVNWRVTGAVSKVKAVLLSGYYDSTVSGTGDVRVTKIGNNYAYESGSAGYRSLQNEVIGWTGKTIETFQGKYSGSTFMVGGRN